MTKWLILVAGPNGAGKSTFVASGIIQRTIATPEDAPLEILNPDAVARRIAGLAPVTDAINLSAARQVEKDLENAISSGRSVGVETVLSTPKYRHIVERAKASGYRVLLHYIVLTQPDLHVARVAQRVELGGHPVPIHKIESRYGASLDQLPWFAANASVAFIWDNSRLGSDPAGPALIAEKDAGGDWRRREDCDGMNAAIQEAIRKVVAGQT